MPIKGKQILDDSMELKKLSSGIKILDSSSKLGVNKSTSQFSDPNEYVTKQYVDDLSDDIDDQTIIDDGGVLKVNIKDPVNSDEIGIIVDGTNGIHLNKSDISSTIIAGNGLTGTTNLDGEKTLDVDTLSLAGSGLSGTSSVFSVDLNELSNTFLNKVDTTSQSVASQVTFQDDVTFNTALSTKSQNQFSNDQELVSKLYVDSVAQGIDWKESALLATNQDLNTNWTYNEDTSGNSTSGYSDTLVFNTTISSTDIDSASTSGIEIGDRFLIKNQTDAKQNGIYELTANNTLTRAEDHNGSPESEISGGNAIFIEKGTYSNSGWVLQGQGALIPNTDELVWTQFSGVGSIIAGSGLSKSGNTLDIELSSNSGLEFDAGGDAGKLKVNAKTPSSTDIGIQLTGGVHILKSDISSTIIAGNALDSTVNGDGEKTLDVNATNLAGLGLSSSSGTTLDVNVDGQTIEISTDTLQVKSNGIDSTHISFGTSGNSINSETIPTTAHSWNGSAISGDNIQSVLEALDSDISNINEEKTTASNGLTEVSDDIRLGGTLTQNTTISGDTGNYNLTINEISTLKLATNSGYDLTMNGSAIFTDTVNSKGLEYAANYGTNFTNRSLVDKEYVDTETLSDWKTLEVTGSGVSGTSGDVEYLGSISFDDAIDEAEVYVNGVRLQVPIEAYFDTPGNATPSSGSTLYFDLDELQYDIESDDEIMITYLLN